MKTITICGKTHEIDCNASVYKTYREKFDKGIFEDINVLQKFITKQVLVTQKLKKENPNINDTTIISSLSGLMLDDMDLFVEAATRMAYIMVYTANEKVESYEEWLKKIPNIRTNDQWIVEVTELAVNCFC